MAEHENSRPLAFAEASIVAGLLLFIAPLVLKPMIGLTYLASMLLAFAGSLIAVFVVRGRVEDFVSYLSIGKDQEVALWRKRPARGIAQIAIVFFLGAVITFRDEWTLRADQLAAIIIAVLVLSEVVDRCVKAIRANPR
ncbi:MAG TPA: hypothetical protein VFG44_04405 [Burkholderiales bacterium]|nr:hypothetical protein [Burkholderiales bacterium]